MRTTLPRLKSSSTSSGRSPTPSGPTSDPPKRRGGGDEKPPLTVTGRRLLRGVLAATAVGWAAVGLVLTLMSVLPTPNLGLFGPNLVLHVLAGVVEEQSLVLAAFALLGIAWPLLHAAPGCAGARSWRRCWVW